MTRRLTVKPLTPDRIDTTFPIAQAAVPGLCLEKWRQFATNATALDGATPAAGIMVVENERGYVQGFCTCRLQRDIRHGTVFAVDDLVALDLIDSGPVAAALVDALEARARELGCGAVRLHVAEDAKSRPGSRALHEFLRRSGRSANSLRLVEPVDLVLR